MSSERFIATGLKSVLDGQGRRARWLSSKVGLSESFMSRVIKGERSIDGARAQLVANELGVPIFFIFEATRVDISSTHEVAVA